LEINPSGRKNCIENQNGRRWARQTIFHVVFVFDVRILHPKLFILGCFDGKYYLFNSMTQKGKG
jgi:hypothetical protein